MYVGIFLPLILNRLWLANREVTSFADCWWVDFGNRPHTNAMTYGVVAQCDRPWVCEYRYMGGNSVVSSAVSSLIFWGGIWLQLCWVFITVLNCCTTLCNSWLSLRKSCWHVYLLPLQPDAWLVTNCLWPVIFFKLLTSQKTIALQCTYCIFPCWECYLSVSFGHTDQSGSALKSTSQVGKPSDDQGKKQLSAPYAIDCIPAVGVLSPFSGSTKASLIG